MANQSKPPRTASSPGAKRRKEPRGAGQRAIFHHIAKSAGTSMVHLLQRNYPDGGLLEVYDRRDQRAPDPTPQAFAAYLASLDPDRWKRVRCLAGHSVNFAIPVLTEPFRVFTIIRDPVDRAVSLYHYLKSRPGFGERGGVVGQLIRSRGWSILDIYDNFGGALPKDTGEHQLFVDFFNGQTRTILAPHFPVDQLRMAEGSPEAPGDPTETLDLVMSAHYLLGSATRYGASVARFAAEFGWRDTTVMRENATKDRPSLDDLPGELVETIRSYNALDNDLHERALAELADTSDPSSPSVRNRRQEKALAEKLKHRDEALAAAEQARLALDAKLEQQERELTDLRAELTRATSALEDERTEHNRLRVASSARDRGMQALVDELEERKQSVVQAHEANQALEAKIRQQEHSVAQAQEAHEGLEAKVREHEQTIAEAQEALEAKVREHEQTIAEAQEAHHNLDAKVRDQERELTRQRTELARLEGALEEERTEHNRLRGASVERDRRLQTLADELDEHKQELVQAREANHKLDASAQLHERELAQERAELARLESALEEERTEHNRLRGASTVRDRRLQGLLNELEQHKRVLVEVRQANQKLDATAQQRADELADLHELLSGLVLIGGQLATELGVTAAESSEGVPERGVALLEATLERARLALSTAAEASRELSEQLEARTLDLEAAAERENKLAASVGDLESKLARAHAEDNRHQKAIERLLEERRRMVGHARGLVASRAWRYGHGASRVLRQVTFSPTKKRGAAEVLLAMLETPPQLPAGDPEPPDRVSGSGPQVPGGA